MPVVSVGCSASVALSTLPEAAGVVLAGADCKAVATTVRNCFRSSGLVR